MENLKFTCCICGEEFTGYGNNPYPLNKEEGARCCDDCNMLVIEARIKAIQDNKKESENNKKEDNE